MRAHGLDGFAHGDVFVSGEVVQDDNVAWLQGRDQDLLDIGQEPAAGHGTIQHHRRGHAGQAQTADEGRRFPMPVRDAGSQTLATRGPAVPARHLGGGPGLVDEHQSARIEVELAVEPGRASRYDIGSGLLVCVRRLFLSVIL